MRIGFFIPAWPPGSVANGIVTSLARLEPPLREMGHDIFYVAPQSNERTPDQRVTLFEPARTSFFTKLRYKWNPDDAFFVTTSNQIADAVERLIADKGLDIFQIENTSGWADTIIKRVPIPIVVKLQGPWFILGPMMQGENRKSKGHRRIEREGDAIRHAAAVEAPSNSVLSLVEQYYGQLNCPTRVIPNPILVRPERDRWKAGACDRDLVLFVGRFDRTKGADILLKAYVKLAKKRPKLRLLFVGPDLGFIADDGHRINFPEFAEREIPAPLRDRIEYCGTLSQTEIDKLRAKAYVSVICSRYETFGNTVIEAMATGCPIVATNAGGLAEIIQNGRNGIIVPTDDHEALATAIAGILDDPKLAARLGKQALVDCSVWFDPRLVAERTIDFYSTVVEHYKQTPFRG